MRDTELYGHLLGLGSPWSVSRVELNHKEQRVDVWAEHPAGTLWPCPECGTALSTYDHGPERQWRHLDSCQFMTYLRARPPRVNCPKDGVRQVKLPWAEPKGRFTALFERFAIDVLRESDVLGATRILRVSWDEAHHIMERAVTRGLAAKGELGARRLGVDEKAIAKGHKYFTVVTNLDKGTVEYVGEDRKSRGGVPTTEVALCAVLSRHSKGIGRHPARRASTLARIRGAHSGAQRKYGGIRRRRAPRDEGSLQGNGECSLLSHLTRIP